MKKILILLFIVSFAKIACAQKNFEGVIDYRMYSLSEGQKDTTRGEVQRIIFGKHAINVESFTREGVVWEERIILLDSLKEYVVDHRFKTCAVGWKYNPPKKLNRSIWGMDKAVVIPAIKKILGYDTFNNFLTTIGHPEYGHVDLYQAKALYFKLPEQMATGFFLQGMLFYDDHIMLAMRAIAGVAPYGQINYVATKVEAKQIDDSAFKLPEGYTFKVLKQTEFH